MANFFKDNSDLVFTLNNLDLAEVAALREDNYKLAQQFDNAPTSFEDALDNYNRVKSAATASNRAAASSTRKVRISRTAR